MDDLLRERVELPERRDEEDGERAEIQDTIHANGPARRAPSRAPGRRYSQADSRRPALRRGGGSIPASEVTYVVP